MGVACSHSLHADDADALLGAIKRGDLSRAQRLLHQSPECVRSIPPTKRSQAIHRAAKRGHVTILDLIRVLPEPEERPRHAGHGPRSTPARQTAPVRSDRPTQHQVPARSLSFSDVPSAMAGLPSTSNGPYTPRAATTLTAASTSLHTGTRGPSSATGYVTAPASASTAVVGADTDGLPSSAASPLPSPDAPTPAPAPSRGARAWLNAPDRRGRTPLMTAVLYNQAAFVVRLVELGADPWVGSGRTRRTAVHLAAGLGHAPLVLALLASAVPSPALTPARRRAPLCDVEDAFGFTPLHYAVAGGHGDVAAALLEAGACVTASNHTASVPDRPPPQARSRSVSAALAWARGPPRRAGQPPAGAGRCNPLHLAAAAGDAVCCGLLLRAHAARTAGLGRAALERTPNPRTQLNKDGFQPYMLAGNAGHWHITHMLISYPRDSAPAGDSSDPLSSFLPLPSWEEASGGPTHGSVGPVGPPPLRELASRAWSAKLLSDLARAEADAKAAAKAAAAAASSGGGAGGGFGALVRDLISHRTSRRAAAGGGVVAVPTQEQLGDQPQTGGGTLVDGVAAAGGQSCESAATPLAEQRSLAAGAAGAQRARQDSFTSSVGSRTRPSEDGLRGPGRTTCDVCFDAPADVALRPCPHRLCGGCCRRVVAMHAARAQLPRCPFCQAALRGFGAGAAQQQGLQQQAPAGPAPRVSGQQP